MRVVLQVGLCCLLAGGAWAQRGGMGHGGGMGGGVRSGGGFGGGGGFRGGSGGFNHGFSGGGFRSGFGGFNGYRGFGTFRGTTSFWGGGLGLGFGYGSWGYSSPYYGYPYVGGYWPGYSDAYAPYYGSGYGYASSSPAVTVVYGPQAPAAPAPVYVERASPVTHEYDQFGQEVRTGEPAGGSSPIYLFAFRDGVIRAAASYRLDGRTLHYVTLQREEKQTPLDAVDRDLTLQLNRERRIALQLP